MLLRLLLCDTSAFRIMSRSTYQHPERLSAMLQASWLALAGLSSSVVTGCICMEGVWAMRRQVTDVL